MRDEGGVRPFGGGQFPDVDRPGNHGHFAWLEQRGLTEGKGRAYIAPLFASLTQTALRSKTVPLKELSSEFATKGGLNEQVLSDFEKNGGRDALISALDRVLARIQGAKA